MERRLHRGAVLPVFWRPGERAPTLQRGSDRRGQDEAVLSHHAQTARAGIAAHLIEALRQRLPEPDDVLARPAGEPAPETAVLGRDFQHRSGVVTHRFELAPPETVPTTTKSSRPAELPPTF